jgi:hypothetical protein
MVWLVVILLGGLAAAQSGGQGSLAVSANVVPSFSVTIEASGRTWQASGQHEVTLMIPAGSVTRFTIEVKAANCAATGYRVFGQWGERSIAAEWTQSRWLGDPFGQRVTHSLAANGGDSLRITVRPRL